MTSLFRTAALAVVVAALAGCQGTARPPAVVGLAPSSAKAPAIDREFRGVWVASVENINWPSKPNLTVDQQQAELRSLLNNVAANNFNAVLLQVRPTADALYASELEPWSYYLTGQQGKAPSPMYDPLAFAVAEAHARGLELHAWINPFRVKTKSGRMAMSEGSLAKRHPDWVRSYNGLLWLDPGEPAARDHSLRVVADLVARYDLDGVHIDDYFYPYKEKGPDGRELEFPDAATYAKHGGGQSIGDFRRANINDYVRRLYEQTKSAKPHVKVGISPFGIWRPGNPAQIRGMDAYDMIYGDSLLWLKQGWADYFTPQLYWPIGQTPQSFPVLLNWWNEQNTLARHLWPGLYTTRADGKSATWKPTEVEYQVRTARGISGPTGTIHFSASFLRDAANPVAAHLKSTVFPTAAAVPVSPWLSGVNAPSTPPLTASDVTVVRNADGTVTLSVKSARTDAAVNPLSAYLVQYTVDAPPAPPGARTPTTLRAPIWRQALLGATPTSSVTLPTLPATLAITPLTRTSHPMPTLTLSPLTLVTR